MTRGTLRARLLRWLLLPLGVLWVVDAVHTFLTVRGAINAAYDRSLYASALAISERVTLTGTVPTVDIPPLALEVLDTASQERLFYRVAYFAEGGGETFLTGYRDLPRPPGTAEGALYYDATYRGDPVRVSALATRYPTEPPTSVLVQVAETVGGRGSRTRELVLREALAQLAVILLAAGILWFGVSRGLRPLTEASGTVARRSADDLAPIEVRRAPAEIAPLVRAVNDLMERLRRTIAAQRRFISDASHQLRTPLAVIQTKAELVLREEDPAAVVSAVVDLHEHSRATTRLANQLLSLARSEPGQGGEARRLDLDALARDACAAHVSDAFGRGVDLGYEGQGPVFVAGREVLLREAIANLVQNAVAYGARPGTVTVSVARPAAGEVVLAVEDDGPGIAPAERARVLERFYRAPGARGGGAGLGLPIVAQIAEGHGAALHLLDGAGRKGLRVELRFPEAPQP
ncbi:MAG TPA: sensor histidine kinase N-terminal domain-containing protein [Anaeromyxobacter sp.]|nr:sensor histidine kinase N-terminal domain-containing protein [Anaeromyxobacter sp.]